MISRNPKMEVQATIPARAEPNLSCSPTIIMITINVSTLLLFHLFFIELCDSSIHQTIKINILVPRINSYLSINIYTPDGKLFLDHIGAKRYEIYLSSIPDNFMMLCDQYLIKINNKNCIWPGSVNLL